MYVIKLYKLLGKQRNVRTYAWAPVAPPP